VTPSFEPEYVVGIREHKQKYYAFKLSTKGSIWWDYDSKRQNKKIPAGLQQDLTVREAEVQISEQLYKTLHEAWNKMIIKTAYYEDTYSRGLDGVTYHFSISPLRAGFAWSPHPNSQTGYLAKLSELLGTLSESKDSKKLEKELSNTAEILLKSLK